MNNSVPKLRSDIEVYPYTHQGYRGILVQDALGIIAEPIFLSGSILELLRYIDGERSVREIQLDYVRDQGGVISGLGEVEQLIAKLDEISLLDSAKYQLQKDNVIKDYMNLPTRKAILAGKSYPDDVTMLKSYLEELFSQHSYSAENPQKNIRALIAPNIDLRVGERLYAKAYHNIKHLSPKKILLIGTAHSLQDKLIALTEKDFETPLGKVKTDQNFVKELKKAGQQVIANNDFAHKNEHSLELQLVFLQYLYGEDFSIVPIIFGSFHEALNNLESAAEISAMKDFLALLQSYSMDINSDGLIVAGVDFSHVGLKFGDPYPATSMLTETREFDEKLLEAICKGNGKDFWKLTKEVNDKYKCCGFSTIASLMEIIPETKGHLIDYDIYKEDVSQSAVTFAAILME